MIKECIKPNCRKKYRVCDEGFGLNNCKVCGAPLKLINNEGNESENFKEQQFINTNEETIIDRTMIDSDFVEKVNKLENQHNKELKNEENLKKSKLSSRELEIDNIENIEEKENIVEFKEKEIFEIDEFGYIYFNSIKEENRECSKIILYLNNIIHSVFNLKYDEMIVGRSAKGSNPDIDLVSIDTDKIVSRKHAVLYKRNNDYYIGNLTNQNYLEVNGEVVIKSKDRKLKNGDLILLSKKYKLKYIN